MSCQSKDRLLAAYYYADIIKDAYGIESEVNKTQHSMDTDEPRKQENSSNRAKIKNEANNHLVSYLLSKPEIVLNTRTPKTDFVERMKKKVYDDLVRNKSRRDKIKADDKSGPTRVALGNEGRLCSDSARVMKPDEESMINPRWNEPIPDNQIVLDNVCGDPVQLISSSIIKSKEILIDDDLVPVVPKHSGESRCVDLLSNVQNKNGDLKLVVQILPNNVRDDGWMRISPDNIRSRSDGTIRILSNNMGNRNGNSMKTVSDDEKNFSYIEQKSPSFYDLPLELEDFLVEQSC